MEKNEESDSPGWGASYFMQTTEDVARAVLAAATAASSAPSRPSVVYSSKEDSGSHLQKLQNQVFKVLKGLSYPTEEKRTYNPEVLTSQKRQWASFQLQALHRRILKEPSRLFESMVVVGLHPNCDIQSLEEQYFGRRSEGSGRLQSPINVQRQSASTVENIEPQVLFVYPPDKQLPLKYRDLLSFCFPGGLEVNAVERTPSMSELNEILLGQDHLKQSDLSFVFRLQGADDSILYGCCLVADELVQKPSRLISMMSDGQPVRPALSRHILTTRRCYCILSRLPLFDLHFGVLNSIFTEERLERLTQSIGDLDLECKLLHDNEVYLEDKTNGISAELGAQGMQHRTTETVQLSGRNSTTETATGDRRADEEYQSLMVDSLSSDKGASDVPADPSIITDSSKQESIAAEPISNYCDSPVYDMVGNNQPTQRHIPNAILPLLRYQQYDSSESSSSFQGSPCDDRNFRSELDLAEMEVTSFSSQEDNEHDEILDWAKANDHGSLQIICEYYRLRLPARGSTVRFHPLEHLHPLEFHRPDETLLHIAGSAIDFMSCSTSFELAEAHNALAVEEEATALSVWAIACLCGSLRLEHVLTIFAGALLEKQIVFVCSNLGILSASVLAIIPLIRPYHWQSFLMPVLPNDMLDFLDAPVPFVVGVKHKTAEVQSKSANVIFVDANKKQVKSSSIPHLPQHKALFTALSPYHAQLVGESYLGRRRPVYDCSDVQVEAAKGFLRVLRSYLDSLCSNLRSHTITNVQSNDDKVSLLLKESFIESFPSRDRPFMKLFVETQLFSVHTDLVLSFFQKD
ncbi:uncharacterized protein LOC112507017 isoform X2 [Cynara cardunculus var. scolymus]|uniref:DDENN domain-containing protein n=1 Tax=Cynara cardunculus var. scolymus TaxID=59895 RepID=A0A103YN64_CYNCS|nr:uncharacterized protein LOC112507017 isoform X2 [Cynara cardunculus var. scolymus]KVI12201.1 dDENN domain-containing protein [Cynara cardunculus var. scolymus]